MRIGVNLIPLRPGQMGGHEFYVRSLLEHLLAHDRHNRYFLFTAPWNDDSLNFQHGRYRKILVMEEESQQMMSLTAPSYGSPVTPACGLSLSASLAVEAISRSSRVGASLAASTVVLPDDRSRSAQLPIPTVITVADIQQEFYPEFFTREELHHRALMYPLPARRLLQSSPSPRLRGRA
jgi:hypothetical protein